MNILNRYILRKFLRPFVASFAVLSILILLAQFFEQLDRFLMPGVKWPHVVAYLFSSLPFQSVQILPVACLLGTLFVVGELARNREYTAGLAGGLPPEKFLGGILTAGLAISVLTLIFNEMVVPPTMKFSNTIFREEIRKLGSFRQRIFHDLVVSGSEGRLWNIDKFNEAKAEMDRVIVDTFREGRLHSQIDATRAIWKIDSWIFDKGVIRTFAEDGINLQSIQPFKEKVFPFSEQPSDPVTQEPQSEEMNFHKLERHIERLESLGVPSRKLRVELLMKVSFPFACFVVTVLGIPLALRGHGNRAIGIAAAGLLSLSYMGFVEVGKALAQRLIPPLTGAWLGNIVFLIIGLILWVRMRRAV